MFVNALMLVYINGISKYILTSFCSCARPPIRRDRDAVLNQRNQK